MRIESFLDSHTHVDVEPLLRYADIHPSRWNRVTLRYLVVKVLLRLVREANTPRYSGTDKIGGEG